MHIFSSQFALQGWVFNHSSSSIAGSGRVRISEPMGVQKAKNGWSLGSRTTVAHHIANLKVRGGGCSTIGDTADLPKSSLSASSISPSSAIAPFLIIVGVTLSDGWMEGSRIPQDAANYYSVYVTHTRSACQERPLLQMASYLPNVPPESDGGDLYESRLFLRPLRRWVS